MPLLSNLMAARSAFGLSLGFHIIFACFGMILPFLVAIAHYRHLKSGNPLDLTLTQFWTRILAIFFAVGAVSGTALSFEIGLLWPTFMQHAGPIIGMPFSLEGTAFFLEAVALGVYLYGRGRIHPWVHWGSIILVGITGLSSGLFVIAANSWMNAPSGFDWVNGQAINIDPVAAMLNPGWLVMSLHMTLAAAMSVAFAVIAFHAVLLLKNPAQQIHRNAIKIAMMIAIPATFLQPLSGDISAKWVAKYQPVKLAAFESLFNTTQGAPLIIGGIPDVDTQSVKYGIHLPYMLSFLATGDFNGTVQGLNSVPRELWPPITVTHIAFQVMVGLGMTLIGVCIASLVILRKGTWPRRWLQILVASGPLGFVALEAGWIVTEVGRQPWIIYGIMKTKDAVTPMPGLNAPFLLFTGMYVILSVVVVSLTVRSRHMLS